jgi:pimeloyl-ACP methyl ester carboxylesterase
MKDVKENNTIVNSSSKGNVEVSPIHSIHGGNGAPVVLIHGLAASVHDWDDLIPALHTAGYSTYALDLPGHGNSTKPDQTEENTIDYLSTKFYSWIDSLHIQEPITLIGHSLGAYLALQYAMIHPERVFALVLCNPLYSLSQLPYLLRLNYRHPIIKPGLLNHIPEWLVRRIIDLTSLSIRNGYELPESVRKQTAEDYKRIQPEIFDIVPTLKDLTPKLHSITQPTLVMWGEYDRTLAVKSFFKIQSEIQNSIGYSIPDAGHVPHQSHSTEFNKRVLEFLRNISQK